MRTIHRVAWRMEKPRLVTWDLIMGVAFTLTTLAYLFGWWTAGRWDGVWLSSLIALLAFGEHAEARVEYRQYLRIKGVQR